MKSPYIKLYTSDFLNGVIDLSVEEIGVYAVIIALIGDRGSPLELDYQWLGRRAGTSTRGAKAIVKSLAAKGKVEIRGNMLGQRRAIEEVAKRDQISSQNQQSAFARWNNHDSPELPLANAETAKKTPEKAAKTDFKNDLKPPVKNEKSQNSAKTDDANASFPSRARAIQTLELESTNDQTLEVVSESDFSDWATLSPEQQTKLRMESVFRASGYFPSTDRAVAQAKTFVEKWMTLHIDWDRVVIGTIQRMMAKTDDPVTSSLARFDRSIRAAAASLHAKAATAPRKRAEAPLADPVFEFDDEPPVAVAFRKGIFERIGHARYLHFCEIVAGTKKRRFWIVTGERVNDDAPILSIRGQGSNELIDAAGKAFLVQLAQSLDFVDVY